MFLSLEEGIFVEVLFDTRLDFIEDEEERAEVDGVEVCDSV